MTRQTSSKKKAAPKKAAKKGAPKKRSSALNPHCKPCELRLEGYCKGRTGTTSIPVCERYEDYHAYKREQASEKRRPRTPARQGSVLADAGRLAVGGMGAIMGVKLMGAAISMIPSGKKV